jgi:hypothetical protein
MGDRGWGCGDDNDNNEWISYYGVAEASCFYLCIVPYIQYFVQTIK